MGFAALGFLPLLGLHVWGLLTRPHYQFIVVLPIAIWLLVSDRDVEEGTDWRRGWLPLVGFVLGLVGLVAAVRLWSPWVAAVSALSCAPSCAWMLGGNRALTKWAPAWVMSWILVPLPYGRDEDLIVELRTVTTRLSSGVLDQLGLLHLTYGNVIELPHKSLFIADACSGIHSLYVLLAAALFVGLWLKRNWLHIALLLISTLGLVLIENVSRIVIVALALGWRMDLSFGTNHQLLGFALFAISLMLVISSDRLIQFLIGSVPEGWKSPRRAENPRPISPLLAAMTFMISLCFLPLGAYQVWAMRGRLPSFAELTEQDIALPQLGEDALPEMVGAFSRKAYTTIQRVHGDPFGQASQQWTYAGNGVTLLVSVDYPYQGVHDLCVCYGQTGWSVEQEQVLEPEELRALDPGAEYPLALGRLEQRMSGHGVLLFSLCDLDGNVIAVIKDLARGTGSERLQRRLDGEQAPPVAHASPPYLQFQVLARTHHDLTQQRLDELLRFYLEVRKQLMPRCLEEVGRSRGSQEVPLAVDNGSATD